METYLPYPSIKETIAVLRRDERVQARNNAIKVLNIRHEVANWDKIEYLSHPVVRMWVDHEPFLIEYAMELTEALKEDTTKYQDTLSWHLELCTAGEYTMAPPHWFGDSDFHLAHKSMLLRVDPIYYSTVFPTVSMSIPPIWPHKL